VRPAEEALAEAAMVPETLGSYQGSVQAAPQLGGPQLGGPALGGLSGPALGSLWSPSYDVCVEDTPQELGRCVNSSEAVHEAGQEKRAEFYSTGRAEGLASCAGLKFEKANRQRLSHMVRRFLGRV